MTGRTPLKTCVSNSQPPEANAILLFIIHVNHCTIPSYQHIRTKLILSQHTNQITIETSSQNDNHHPPLPPRNPSRRTPNPTNGTIRLPRRRHQTGLDRRHNPLLKLPHRHQRDPQQDHSAQQRIPPRNRHHRRPDRLHRHLQAQR